MLNQMKELTSTVVGMRSSWTFDVSELGAKEEFGLDFMLMAVFAAVDAAAELSTAITLDTPDPTLDTLRSEPGALLCSLDTLFKMNIFYLWPYK